MQPDNLGVAAVRELARAVDRDVSEIRGFRRATVASVNTLRTDMVDMRRDITDMRQEMRSKFALTAAGQERIAGLIQQVIDGQGGTAQPAPVE
ncbi:hypothetical protein [Mycobacterium sp. UM_WGJ]|nr:hypothetical protein [Mycobacterium sp. UM_WGJ]